MTKRSYHQGSDNPMWGRHHTEQAKERIRAGHIAEKNGMWKGDNVGTEAIHDWVKDRIPKPGKCQRCNEASPYDLSNKSGEYLRDLGDWEWLCRRCHMVIDGRLERQIGRLKARTAGWWQKCRLCSNRFWVTPSRWRRGDGRYCSGTCGQRGRHMPEVF